jgi:hypothetical protein
MLVKRDLNETGRNRADEGFKLLRVEIVARGDSF